MGLKQVRDGENKQFSTKMRQYHSPDGVERLLHYLKQDG